MRNAKRAMGSPSKGIRFKAQRSSAPKLSARPVAQAPAPDPTTTLGPNIPGIEALAFRAHLVFALTTATPSERRMADMFAAFGSEAVKDEEGMMSHSRLSKQNGNSGKNMLADMQSVMGTVTHERLADALFKPWDYADDKWSLGWDPADVRPFAHQANDPAEGSKTMHGAKLVAYEALALFPVVVDGHDIATTGTSRIVRSLHFSWPIWEVPIGVEILRSLVAHQGLHCMEPDHQQLRSMGVAGVFRSEHFSFNKSSRFKPARPV